MVLFESIEQPISAEYMVMDGWLAYPGRHSGQKFHVCLVSAVPRSFLQYRVVARAKFLVRDTLYQIHLLIVLRWLCV